MFKTDNQLNTNNSGLTEEDKQWREAVVDPQKIDDLFDLLEQKKVDPNKADEDGKTHLHFAIEKGRRKAVKALLQNDVDPNSLDGVGVPPVWLAASLDESFIIEDLALNGANLDAINLSDGSTALHEAVKKKSFPSITQLIFHGVKTDLTDSDGKTAEDYADPEIKEHIKERLESFKAMHNNIAAEEVSLPEQQIIRTNDFTTPAPILEPQPTMPKKIHKQNNSLFQQLISGKTIISKNSGGAMLDIHQQIRTAIHNESANLIELIKQQNADPNHFDAAGWNHLHYAIEDKKLKGVKDLISAGADSNMLRERSVTSLWMAAYHNLPEIMQVLLENGAKVNTKNRNSHGYTALHQAVINGSKEAIEVLYRNNADDTVKDGSGKTPLAHASKEIASYIEQLKARLEEEKRAEAKQEELEAPYTTTSTFNPNNNAGAFTTTSTTVPANEEKNQPSTFALDEALEFIQQQQQTIQEQQKTIQQQTQTNTQLTELFSQISQQLTQLNTKVDNLQQKLFQLETSNADKSQGKDKKSWTPGVKFG